MFTRTTTELLEGLRDPANTGAWAIFVQRYRPVVVAYAKRCGLQPADAEEIAQETIIDFLRIYPTGRYHRSQGTRLRDWLKGIAANRVREFFRQRAKTKEHQVPSTKSQLGFFASVPDREQDDPWEEEWRRHILTLCLQTLQSEFDGKTLKAFEEYALRQRPVEEVMQDLGMSSNAVYIAKSRVLERMSSVVQDFDLAEGVPA